MAIASTSRGELQHGLRLSGVPDPNTLVEYAVAADESGWDGVFHLDHLIDFIAREPDDHRPLTDPWVAWAAVAAQTEHIILGSSITPIPRRQPWQLAKNLAIIDRLSDGRVVLGAGLGAPKEFTPFGEAYDQKQLAERYDEALDVITGLWTGEPFSYDGDHFTIDDAVMRPTPFQEPRIPIVIGGWWPFKTPFKRGARWDGIFPNWPSMHVGSPYLEDVPDHMRRVIPDKPDHLGDIRKMLKYYHDIAEDPGEIMLYAMDSAPDDLADICRELGATWLIHGVVDPDRDKEVNLEEIRQGPPG